MSLLSGQHMTILLAVAVLIIGNIILRLLSVMYRKRKDLKLLKHFNGPAPHWIFGNLNIQDYGQGHKDVATFSKTYKDAFIYHLGFTHYQVELVSPRSVQAILSTSEPKDSIMYPFLRPWIGNGLLLSSGKLWSRNRRLLTPAFHFDILKPYQHLFSQCTNVMLHKWEDLLTKQPDESLEMFEHVSMMTLSCLMKCIFGIQSDIQETGTKNPYVQAVNNLTHLTDHRIGTPWHYNDLIYYFTLNGFKYRKYCNVAHQFSGNVISNKRKEKSSAGNGNNYQNTDKKKYVDFIDILLECRDSDGTGLTDQEIQAEVDTFMFEGHDTTSSGISWCLYNLACHQKYQEKCRNEVCTVLGNKDTVEWEDLSKLTYLTMFIKESLRTHPPVPGIARETTKDITLHDKRVIPAGSFVGIAIYAVHMDDEFWPNPEVFDPERFSPDASKGRHPYAFVPFSAGPRNCIGQNFALNEMKTSIALMLKKFHFDIDSSKETKQLLSLVLRARDGLWLKVKKLQ